jgi:hypothetical protein
MTLSAALTPGTLEVLASTPATLRALLASLPDAAVRRAGDEGWSAHDVLAHLASRQGEALGGRLHAIVEQDNPLIASIGEEDALERSGFRQRSLAELLDGFASERAEIMAWVRTIPPASLTRTGRHEEAGIITAADILHHFAFHDLLHTRQICTLIEAPIEANRGAMGAAFPADS